MPHLAIVTGFCLLLFSCGIGINPMTASDSLYDPNDPDSPTNPNNPNLVPTLASISPTSGARGTLVTLLGAGMGNASTVTIGGGKCIVTQVVSTGQLVCRVMANGPGAWDVEVHNANGTNAALESAYTYRTYIYVQRDSTFVGYSLLANGALTKVTESAGAVASNSTGLVVDPLGRFLYSLGLDAIRVHRIDGGTGAISEVPGSPFIATLSGFQRHLILDETGQRGLILTESESGLYSISDSGALTEIQVFENTTISNRIAYLPTRGFLFFPVQTPAQVTAYHLDFESALFSELPTSPQAVTISPVQIRNSPDERSILLAETSGSIQHLTVASDGTLAKVGEILLPNGLTNLSFHPQLPYFYALTSGTTFHRVRIDSDLSLESQQQLTVSESATLAIDPSGQFVIGAKDGNEALRLFSLSKNDGTIEEISTGIFEHSAEKLAFD